MLGGVLADGSLIAAPGAEIQVALAGIGAHRAAVAAVVAHRPAVGLVDAVLEYQGLIVGGDILLVRQVALVQHLAQDAFLAVAVALLAVAHLALVHIHAGGVGVEQRGVIGNADQAGTLRHGQALQLLAEVSGGGGLDAIAPLAQVDAVEVLLHNDVFVVFLFQQLRAENLHHLSLHGDALFIGGILDQLLRDGGAAELGVAAKEHIGAGLHGGDPVHALMLVKPLVLDGDGGIHQRLGDLIPGGGLAVGGGINLLKQLDIAVAVYVVHVGGLFDIVILIRPVLGLLQNVVLKIFRQCAHKHHAADQADQQHRRRRADGDLGGGKHRGAGGINQLYRPVRIPFLADFFPSSIVLFLICHRKPPKLRPGGPGESLQFQKGIFLSMPS